MKDNTAAVHVQVPVEVTSFLLNEKRTEITKIEPKQRHRAAGAEQAPRTPNYRLERLRHDDPRLRTRRRATDDRGAGRRGKGITRRESGPPSRSR